MSTDIKDDAVELSGGDFYVISKLGGDAGIERVRKIMLANNAIETDQSITAIRNAYALVYNKPMFGKPRMMIVEEHSNVWARKREVELPDLPKPVDDSVYRDALEEVYRIAGDVLGKNTPA